MRRIYPRAQICSLQKKKKFSKRGLGKPSWLETHIWHAKRMKIVTKWGFKLPLKANCKQHKSIIYGARKYSVIHDSSYYRLLEITGNLNIIKSLLEEITDPTLVSVANEVYLSGQIRGETFFYKKNAYPNGAIGPACFLWNKNALWMWVHPVIEEEVKSLIQVSQVNVVLRTECILSLFGPFSLEILKNALMFNSSCKNNCVLRLSVRRALVPKKITPESLLEFHKEEDSNVLSKSDKVKLDDILEFDKEEPSEAYEVLLVKKALKDLVAWDLILPRKETRDVWKRLILSGCKPIGLTELDAIYLEAKAPLFPNDFAGTEAYDVFAKEVEAEELKEHLKRPPAKRLNYAKMDEVSPFRPQFELLRAEALIQGKWHAHTLNALLRSATSSNEVLELLSAKFSSLLGKFRPELRTAYSESALRCALVRISLFPSKALKRGAKIMTETREVIGYVTRGSASVTLGAPFGIGSCILREVLSLILAKKTKVILKNIGGRKEIVSKFFIME